MACKTTEQADSVGSGVAHGTSMMEGSGLKRFESRMTVKSELEVGGSERHEPNEEGEGDRQQEEQLDEGESRLSW
jgi:hypothetical protein